jgi:hypothetical protein
MEWVLVYFVLLVIAIGYAASKRRPLWIWVPVAVLMPPLAILGVLLSPKGGRAPCPACREPVDTKASVCPHCRRELEPGWARA